MKTKKTRCYTKYTVQAIYKDKVELEVEVKDGTDPKDPQNWLEIHSEHQRDYYLYDVESTEEGWDE